MFEDEYITCSGYFDISLLATEMWFGQKYLTSSFRVFYFMILFMFLRIERPQKCRRDISVFGSVYLPTLNLRS